MNLYLSGHDYKYAVEQIMMVLFPEERPEYGAARDAECNFASVSASRGAKLATVSVKLRVNGAYAAGRGSVGTDKLTDKLSTDREMQRIIKLAFYRAAIRILPRKPAWGALTGVRPGTFVTKMLRSGMTETAAMREMERAYFVSPERAALCIDTAKASMAAEARLKDGDAALYIGIPFCPTRCAYCSFVSQSVEKSAALIPPFTEALDRELTAAADEAKRLGLRIVSVYMGGGTPTTLSPEQLEHICSAVKERFAIEAETEFCVEAGRPDTVTPGKMAVLKACGVNRISINPQTMNDDVLSAIGRRHSADDVRKAYGTARKFFGGAVNMDLIAGLPGDTVGSFKATLDEVIAMAPENITVHTLSLKKGTRITLEGTPLPDENTVGAMLDYAAENLRGAGYTPYYLYRQKFMSGGFENVGWSKPGRESFYNIFIMEELGTILACGGGASEKFVDRKRGKIERRFNPKYPKEYIERIDEIMEKRRKTTQIIL